MSVATIRTAIYNAVNGVTGVGVVYDYERFANDWDTFLSLFKQTVSSTDQIRGFEVAYRGFTNSEPWDFSGSHSRVHLFHVMGYMGIDDANSSEKTFANLVEDVADGIDAAAALRPPNYHDTPDVSINEHEPRMFGGVLCHYANIHVTVSEDTA